jgi:[protein-PII] uridylyltransferase
MNTALNTFSAIPQSASAAYAAHLAQCRLALFGAPATTEETTEVIKRHAMMLDQYFQSCFESSVAGPEMDFIKNPYAIVALGGYGRSEQCVHSDVDLLFVFQKRVPASAEALIREMVYPMWDLKLEVGYATRSIDECVVMARDDYEILTSILDARFICGISSVFSKLRDQITSRIISRHSQKLINWLLERNGKRHQDFGDSTFLLQPNLKEGNGGLRDYHTLRWIAGVTHDVKEMRDLEYQGVMSFQEYQDLHTALSFIWNVRNKLHLLTKRRCDQLYFEYQQPVAEAMGYTDEKTQTAVERFLGDLHSHMTFIKHQLQLFLYEFGDGRKRKWRLADKKVSQIPGIIIERGRLNFVSPETILAHPEILIQMFEASAQLKIPLSREAERLVREFNYLVDDGFRASFQVRDALENILMSPIITFSVLEQMLNSGFLVSLIPEYAGIVNRIQYDAYHLYPVDRHMLRTVQNLKMLGSDDNPEPDDLAVELYHGLKRKLLLLLAALLHDIGKGHEGRHSLVGAKIAGRIMRRMGYKPKDIELVVFLIENHLLLMKTATRRDINDEETAIVCARQIKDPRRLKILYLLTVADSRATGPKAWNNWTASLLRDFFLKVLSILEKGEFATVSAVNRIEKKRAAVLQKVGHDISGLDAGAVFDQMSPRYVLATAADDILSHMNLYNGLKNEAFVWNVRHDETCGSRIVTVCAKDRPGLFSKIAGVFTLNHINILDAQANTWNNGVALDIFVVEPPPDQLFEEERWKRVKDHLGDVLTGKLDLAARLAQVEQTALGKDRIAVSHRPNRVVIDNDSSSFFTIIEVFACDFKGLLFKITDVISRLGLNIAVAKVATKVDQVVDVFYVRDESEAKIKDQAFIEKIKKEILTGLPF